MTTFRQDSHGRADWKLESPEGKRAKVTGGSLEGFAEFWKAYPRHVAKGAAKKAWRQLAPSRELAEQMTLAAELQARTNYADRPKKTIPHPATWIRAEQWDDEIEEPVITPAERRLHIHTAICFESGCPFDPIRRL